jgi:hypothetical protein
VITPGGDAGWQTIIKRTVVVIVTHADNRRTDTGAVTTDVIKRADVVVIAEICVVCEKATFADDAGICRTFVTVIADKVGRAGITCATAADVVQTARFAVITGRSIVFVNAPDERLASVACTNIAVIAVKNGHTRDTIPGLAGIVQSTRIQVVTRISVRYVDATVQANRDATIVGADIFIITVQTIFTRDAGATEACVPDRADIFVITRDVQEFMNTAEIGVAGILRTRVLVPASNQRAFAHTIYAKITFSTQIAVVAHAFDILVHATAITAHVSGAGIIVVTVHGICDAQPFMTAVIHSAGIKVVTGKIVIRKQLVILQSCLTRTTYYSRVNFAIFNTFAINETPTRFHVVGTFFL